MPTENSYRPIPPPPPGTPSPAIEDLEQAAGEVREAELLFLPFDARRRAAVMRLAMELGVSFGFAEQKLDESAYKRARRAASMG